MRSLIFMGDCKESLSGFPDEVKREMGIKTPKPDLELIEARYKAAKRLEEDNV